MVALSQQGADLGFVLGAPLLGAVVGITASIVGMAFAFSGVNVELEKTAATVPELVKRFNELDDAAKKLALGVVAAEIIAQEKALKDTKEALEDFQTGLHLFSSTKDTSAKISEYTGTIQKLELALKDLKTVYKDLSPDGSVLSAVMQGIEAQNAELINQAMAVDELITSNISLANTYGMSALQVQLYKAELVGANAEQKEAIELSFAMAEAKRAEVEANKSLYDIAIGQTEADPALANSQLLHEQRLRDEQTFQEAIAEIKFTGAETVDELYFKELAVHKAMLDSKLVSEEDFAKAQLKLATQYSKSKVDEKKLDDKSLLFKEENARKAMSLASFVFEDSKAVSAGIAFINTAEGVTAALAKQNYAGATLTALTGAAQIANILGASKGGGAPASIQAPAAPKEPDFVQDTASLDFTDSSAGGSSTNEIRFATDSGDELVDAIAEALNKGQREGRYS